LEDVLCSSTVSLVGGADAQRMQSQCFAEELGTNCARRCKHRAKYVPYKYVP
jgi:hypothetical protein